MTKFFKNRSNKAVQVKEAPPRDLSTIQADYAKMSSQAGTLQYQILVYQKQLEQLNNDLMRLNSEAAKRAELDKATQTEESTNA